MKKYLFYILNKCNQQVFGVISEDGDNIVYDGLTNIVDFDIFQNKEIHVLKPYYDSPSREVKKNLLGDNIDQVEITKDYLTAICHSLGKERKAVAQSTENA